MHKSIATINSPEFINLQPLDINPLMSSCEIKVLYIGENRNHSFITKEVATEMAKTLRGAPIVGYYRTEKEDYTDHGNRMIIDDEGIKFECMTTPYGFVSPDAKVWFQTFEDTDEFGNTETREYLMTTGYLWTGQFEECKVAVEEGRPQSMELDEATLDGHWATNKNNGMDFFIINDAIFSKLCILGDDVEPCFEGSSVTAPKVSASFTKMDEAFRKTLFTMMQELQFALQGGQQMENEVKTPEVVEEVVETPVEPSVDNTPAVEDAVIAPVVEEATPVVEETAPVVEEPATPAVENAFAASEDDDKKDGKSKDDEDEEEASKDEDDKDKKEDFTKKEDEDKSCGVKSDENSDAQKDDDEEKKKKDFELLQQEYNTLKATFDEMKVKYDELVAFKANIEEAEKDAMINKFYFLSDADKKDVIENKANYTLEEIESKLSVISVRNKVNFNLDDNNKNDINKKEENVLTYSINNDTPSIPAWISAVINTQNKK